MQSTLSLTLVGWLGSIKKRTNNLSFMPLVLAVLLTPAEGLADGFRNPFQGASAIGQGNAFAAQADDPTAIHYNPAGITQLRGIQQSVGIQFISPHTTFTNSTGQTAHNQLDGPIGLPHPGQFFITANLGDVGLKSFSNLSVGLGLQSLYGFASEYPRNSPLSSSVIHASLPLLDVRCQAYDSVSIQ